MNKAVIELQNIKRNFQVGDETVHALRGVSFTIREGEFVTIMGTSGSGKSTLLNTLGCLDLAFFGAISCFLSIIGCILMVPVLKTYFLTGLVPRFPTLIVSGYLLIAALQLFCVGLTLQTILKKNRQDFELELYRVMEQEKRTIM